MPLLKIAVSERTVTSKPNRTRRNCLPVTESRPVPVRLLKTTVLLRMKMRFHVPAHGRDSTLLIRALLTSRHRVAVVDRTTSVDDGAIVDLCDVVCGRANQLDAALKRLVVGLRPNERGQKRVMDIDQVLEPTS